MTDFHQTGVITSLHRLGREDLPRLEKELVEYSANRPIALVLPSLFSEVHGPALSGIVEELTHVPYLRQVVVSLSGPAEFAQFREMRSLLEDVRCMDGSAPTVIWNDGPRVQSLLEMLRHEGLDPGPEGKGRATWMAYGYVLAMVLGSVVSVGGVRAGL